MGRDRDITESHLSKREKEALTAARQRAEERGSSSIQYEDYDTGSKYDDIGGRGFTGGGKGNKKDTTMNLIKRLFNPGFSMKTSFGAMGFKKNEDETYTYTDQYNFNDAKEGGMEGYRKELEDRRTACKHDLTTYQKLRLLAKYKGSGEGEGSNVNVRI